MNSLGVSQFPSLFIPTASKTADWHRQFVQSIATKGMNSTFSGRVLAMQECYNFYNGTQRDASLDFIMTAEDGSALPAKWMDFNKIAVKVDLLIGELAQRGFRINVEACNKEAQSRKMDEKNRLLIEMRFQPIAEELENQSGLPLQSDESFVPETTKELDVYMNKTYKETSEIVMRGILNYLRKYDEGSHVSWEYTRMSTFRDLLIAGAMFARNEIIDGIPTVTRVDPRMVIYDTNAKDDFLSDAGYWAEVAYLSIGEATKRYTITAEELQSAYNSYMEFTTGANAQQSQTNTDFSWYNTNDNQTPLFRMEGGELRILVVKAFWQDYKTLSHKYSPDKYGNTHIKRVTEEDSGKESVKNTVIQVWRQGHLIGGKFIKEWGLMKNQERSVDNIATTTPPYVALIPNYFNGAIISKVSRFRALQNLKNIVMYNVQLQISRSGAKGFLYDVSQLPKGWDIHTAIKYIKVAGIGFMDSSREGAGQYNQFKEFDMGISQSVTQMLQICQFLDAEMDSVSGVNEARQGQIQGASQAVGVTNSALLQSNLSTSMYFTLFSLAWTKIMNKQAGLAKIAWAGKERFAPIIGDVGINFLKQDIGLELNDYNVFVEELPPSLTDKQLFQNLLMTGLQQGQVTMLQTLKLMMEPDIDEAINELELDLTRNKEEQQAQQEQENQMQQQQQQGDQQMEQAKLMQKHENDQMRAKMDVMKEQSGLQKILAQGRLDTQQGLLDFKKNVALKNIDLAIQKQKQKDKVSKGRK